jgi:hypothetical protein
MVGSRVINTGATKGPQVQAHPHACRPKWRLRIDELMNGRARNDLVQTGELKPGINRQGLPFLPIQKSISAIEYDLAIFADAQLSGRYLAFADELGPAEEHKGWRFWPLSVRASRGTVHAAAIQTIPKRRFTVTSATRVRGRSSVATTRTASSSAVHTMSGRSPRIRSSGNCPACFESWKVTADKSNTSPQAGSRSRRKAPAPRPTCSACASKTITFMQRSFISRWRARPKPRDGSWQIS